MKCSIEHGDPSKLRIIIDFRDMSQEQKNWLIEFLVNDDWSLVESVCRAMTDEQRDEFVRVAGTLKQSRDRKARKKTT